MANRTAWSGGSLAGGAGAYVSAFGVADMNSLPNLSSVMSGLAFDNTVATLGAPDQFMDVSFVGAMSASVTIPSGSALGLWLYVLQRDGTTYGSGKLVAGTQLANYSPLLNPLGGLPIEPGTTITNISSSLLNVTIPPRAFRLVVQSQLGTGLVLASGMISIATYCQNTNA